MVFNRKHVGVVALTAAMFMLQPAFADKPPGAANNGNGNGSGNSNGNGNGSGKHQQPNAPSSKASKADQARGSSLGEQAGTKKRSDGNDPKKASYSDSRGGSSLNVRFDDRQRHYLRDYYGEQFRAGNCPPGLAKKNNGCMPPGQAKKWRVGHALPRDVVFYDLPSSVMVHIGLPPSGYRYVRVASDILMLALGSGIVVDAIADLSSM